jgi:hypothetical protein
MAVVWLAKDNRKPWRRGLHPLFVDVKNHGWTGWIRIRKKGWFKNREVVANLTYVNFFIIICVHPVPSAVPIPHA